MINPRSHSRQDVGFLTPQPTLTSKMNDPRFPNVRTFSHHISSPRVPKRCLSPGILVTSGQNNQVPGQGIPGIQKGQDVGQSY